MKKTNFCIAILLTMGLSSIAQKNIYDDSGNTNKKVDIRITPHYKNGDSIINEAIDTTEIKISMHSAIIKEKVFDQDERTTHASNKKSKIDMFWNEMDSIKLKNNRLR